MNQIARHLYRDELKLILSHLDDRWVRAANKEISLLLERLIETSLNRLIKHVLAWLPTLAGEVNLSDFIRRQISKREVYLPRLNADGALSFFLIDRDSVAAQETSRGTSRFGTLNVPFDTHCAEETAILVPALAFDRRGIRISRGYAHYQKLFNDPRMRRCCSIGVVWSIQSVSEIPGAGSDVAVEWVCTEKEWFFTGVAAKVFEQ